MQRVYLRLAGVAFAVASAFSLVSPASAQAVGEGVEADSGAGGVGGGVTSFGFGDWLGLGLRLALVIAVIWVAVAAMRWYVRRLHGGGGRHALGALEVVETHVLGPNRTLHLVRLGDRAVLVGATQERITQLLTVDDPEELKRLIAPPEEPTLQARGGGVSLLASLRTGLMAMQSSRTEMNARMRARRAAGAVERATAGPAPAGVRRAGLRGMLSAATSVKRPRQEAAAPVESPLPVEPASRPSLFERTLASIDAIEIAAPAPTAAGLRARAGYGAASQPAPTPRMGDRRSRTSAAQREQQIVELQRAIAAARKSAS